MWYDFGIDSSNSREHLDVTKLHKSTNCIDALPSIYDFTGKDYMPAVQRKRKICHLYGYTKQADIHDVIKNHFESKTKPKPSKMLLECIKSIESTKLPPCRDVLTNK